MSQWWTRFDQILHRFIRLPVIMIMPSYRPCPEKGNERREKRGANRLQGDRLDDIQIVTKSSRVEGSRERERRSTRSRPLIYDKGERWPEWCKLGVISHHLGIRCTLCASRVEHAISVRAVPSSAREENCILERERKREGGRERVIFVHWRGDSEGFRWRFSAS